MSPDVKVRPCRRCGGTVVHVDGEPMTHQTYAPGRGPAADQPLLIVCGEV